MTVKTKKTYRLRFLVLLCGLGVIAINGDNQVDPMMTQKHDEFLSSKKSNSKLNDVAVPMEQDYTNKDERLVSDVLPGVPKEAYTFTAETYVLYIYKN